MQRGEQHAAFERILRAVTSEQQADGLWHGYAWELGGEAGQIPTPYFTLLIAGILDAVAKPPVEPRLHRALTRARRAIAKERSKQNTYNYWLRGSDREAKNPIPDDWDDTALAYAALHRYPRLQAPKPYHLLRNSRDAASGLFETWILSQYPPKWHDLDPWVNLNVMFWLLHEEVVIAEQWVATLSAFLNGRAASQYYPDNASACFFFARLLAVPKAAENIRGAGVGVIDLVAKMREWVRTTSRTLLDDTTARAVQSAWAIAALSILEPERQSRTKELAARHAERALAEPNQAAYPVIYGWQGKATAKVYDGSRALALSLLVFALQYDPETAETNAEHERTAVIERARHALSALSIEPLVREGALLIVPSDFAQEVFCLPAEIAALCGSAAQYPSDIRVMQEAANLIGWTYFWVDDAILDNHQLPDQAERLMERSLAVYERLQTACVPARHPFWEAWSAIQNGYQKARAYEVHVLRFDPDQQVELPDLLPWDDILAKKFGPYMAAVLASLATLTGPATYAETAEPTAAAYRHYLLAKQLNDDARDCLPDLRGGRLTECTERILRALPEGTAPSSLGDKEIEAVFVRKVSKPYNRRIRAHIEAARRTLKETYPESWRSSRLEKRLSALEEAVLASALRQEEVVAIFQEAS